MSSIKEVHIKKHKIIKDIKLEITKKNSIFFGWNGTGKSTFSNIFYEISINGDNAKQYESFFPTHNFTSDNNIKVFNKKYIDQNLSDFLDGEHKKDKIILGEENQENNKKLENNEREKQSLQDSLIDADTKKKKIEDNLDKEKTKIAKRAKDSLGENNYKFSPEPNKNSIKYPEKFNELKKLDSRELNNNIIIFQQQKKEKLEELKIDNFSKNFQAEEEKLQELFKQTTFNEVIKKLKSNETLNSWVERGVELHSDGNTCEFCGNELTEQRKQELNNHFNDKYKKLQSNLNKEKEYYKKKITYIKEYNSKARILY